MYIIQNKLLHSLSLTSKLLQQYSKFVLGNLNHSRPLVCRVCSSTAWIRLYVLRKMNSTVYSFYHRTGILHHVFNHQILRLLFEIFYSIAGFCNLNFTAAACYSAKKIPNFCIPTLNLLSMCLL